jgi:hypothetical protein
VNDKELRSTQMYRYPELQHCSRVNFASQGPDGIRLVEIFLNVLDNSRLVIGQHVFNISRHSIRCFPFDQWKIKVWVVETDRHDNYIDYFFIRAR